MNPRCSIVTVAAVLIIPWGQALARQADLFSEDELAWMRGHPIVRIASPGSGQNAACRESGRYAGLAKQYLRRIEKASGLKFEDVDLNDAVSNTLGRDRIDLYPAVLSTAIAPDQRQRILLSQVYHHGMTMIVTRDPHWPALSPGALQGKQVAIINGNACAEILKRHYPAIRFVPMRTAEAALGAVAKGQAYAAMDTENTILPLLNGKYRHQLQVSGVVAKLTTDVSMATRKDLPELASIVNKSLKSIDLRQDAEIIDEWMRHMQGSASTPASRLSCYAAKAAPMAALVAMLLFFIYEAVAEKRDARRHAHSRSRLAARVKHEIHTPMNALLACVSLLRSTALNPAQTRLSEVAAERVDAVVRTLDNINDASELEMGRLTVHSAPTDVAALIAEIMRLAHLRSLGKPLFLRTTISLPTDQLFLVDAIYLRRIIQNLVFQAIERQDQVGIYLDARVVRDAGPHAAQAASLCVTIKEPYANKGTGDRLRSTLEMDLNCRLAGLMGGQIFVVDTPRGGYEVCMLIADAGRCRCVPDGAH